MGYFSQIFRYIAIITVLFFFTCANKSIRVEREKVILKLYTETKKKAYDDLLVDIQRYTTNGAIYHKKYYKYLISIAGDIIEDKNLSIVKGSIGFYFDKKTGDKSKLYLGLDIDAGSNFDKGYSMVSIMLLRDYLKDILQTINSCKTIFNEKEIIGMVVGFKWTSNNTTEQLNIWINKDDVIRFENNRLTFNEILQMSTITNTDGKIIVLSK